MFDSDYRFFNQGLALAAIHTLRALITFESDDVATAKASLRNVLQMADILRRPETSRSVFSSVFHAVANVVRPGSTLNIKNMTPIQCHAELIHAEVYLMRAILAIVMDGNILSFVREGFNIRQSFGTYTAFWSHIEKTAKGKPDKTQELDNDLLVGALFGMGTFNLILSLLPPKVVKLFEVVGYGGDQDFGLAALEVACGFEVRPRWTTKAVNEGSASTDGAVPSKSAAATFPLSPRPKGLRQFLGKMQLALFHTVFPTLVPLANADLAFGRRILDEETAKYPNSIPHGQMLARIDLSLASPATSIPKFERLINVQQDWRSLHHLAMWEITLAAAAVFDYARCADMLSTLLVESRWSKTVYYYGLGVCLLALGKTEEATEKLSKVNESRQKIAGRSIPLEKFLARKARRFFDQNRTLVLPELEFFFFFNVFDYMPAKQLREAGSIVDRALKSLRDLQPNGVDAVQKKSPLVQTPATPYPAFYDDVALCIFLRAVVDSSMDSPGSYKRMKQVSPTSVLATPVKPSPSIAKALESLLETIPSFGQLIALEHWTVPFARYVAALCLQGLGEYAKALDQLDLATVGGYNAEDSKAKGWRVGSYTGGGRKFSMEQPLQTRAWNLKRKLDLEMGLQKAAMG